MNEKFELERCPFCGHYPQYTQKPLWHGSHGYHGNYDHTIECVNLDCVVRPSVSFNDIYQSSVDAYKKAVLAWNTRPYSKEG